MPKLIIVRGLPGSGKSTYAKSFGFFHVEADMFHMKDGEYQWNPAKTGHAHAWCTAQVASAMAHGFDIVVSNTFTQAWEFEKYIELAKVFKYKCEVIACTGNYGNIHSVPVESLQKMKDRWENYEGEILI